MLFPFVVLEGVDWILSHDLSDLEEKNIVYRSDCDISFAVLISQYQFLQ